MIRKSKAHRCPIYLLLAGLLVAQTSTILPAQVPISADTAAEISLHIEVPRVVLNNVPVRRIVIRALTSTGQTAADFQAQANVNGFHVTVNGQPTEVGDFRNGVLEVTTDLAQGRRVFVTDSKIRVSAGTARPAVKQVTRLWRWWSLGPPLIAIVLAVWWRNVIVALVVAVWCGSALLTPGNLAVRLSYGFTDMLNGIFVEQLVQSGSTSHDHMLILLFTMFLGAMIGVMSASGASKALVDRLSAFHTRPERGQQLTWFLGLIVFFDDYANSLLVGTTMRPITDRLRISREKLAFLVDSTAAPVASLALVSTWVGFEVGQINDAFSNLGIEVNGFSLFLETLPFRFYPIMLLFFVWLIAFTGRDYGPMLRAEQAARAASPPDSNSNSNSGDLRLQQDPAQLNAAKPGRHFIRNAVIPLSLLLTLLVAGIWWTGSDGLQAENAQRVAGGDSQLPISLGNILSYSNSNDVLLFSSFTASIVAVLCVLLTRSLSLAQAVDAWVDGAKSMFQALIILVLAWSIAAVCNEDNLDTAGFLVELCHGSLPASWMPLLVFLVSAAVSFATGSSFSTMGLLMPLAVALTYNLLMQSTGTANDVGDALARHHLMLATIGAVLAGSIFGDHCSPISDTTVLSSAAAGCDHLSHVVTQLPYAVTVAVIGIAVAYIPIGLGYSTTLLFLTLGVLAIFGVVRLYGRKASAELKTPQ